MLDASIVDLCSNFLGERSVDHVIQSYLHSIATIQDDRIQKKLLEELIKEYVLLEKKVDELLKNTLLKTVVDEIKDRGRYRPRPYECTILFSDIVGFTKIAERMSMEIFKSNYGLLLLLAIMLYSLPISRKALLQV
ncbi:MAG TPA: hypothetical protein PLM71_10315 [Syntrophorhabdaceae bacterium]|nr:hypothetical protein [Syntrophorhabdaceae bacterium]